MGVSGSRSYSYSMSVPVDDVGEQKPAAGASAAELYPSYRDTSPRAKPPVTVTKPKSVSGSKSFSYSVSVPIDGPDAYDAYAQQGEKTVTLSPKHHLCEVPRREGEV